MTKKYCIIAKDKTHVDEPKRLWIYNDRKEAETIFEFLCDSGCWTMEEWIEIDDIVLNGKEYLK